MKSLIHSIYRNGAAGLSNLIMSVELGVVLASLTDRLLILKGNRPPPANVVQYGDLVSNAYPSRVTDLIDLGVAWIDAQNVNLAAFVPAEICAQPAWDSVCYFPANLCIDSSDFRAFAGKRKTYFTIGEDIEHAQALSFTGGADENTLSFYSPFFYLDRAAQTVAHDALSRMKPKAEIAAFAKRISDDLGAFNAVHIRRGDFKITTGVTTLDRTPAEAIEAMDHHFDRRERLVILTDEAEDPFFDEIKRAYADPIFLDWHILHNYDDALRDLPAHDSIALAHISQLVAAHSQDFMGTMTSTFTSLIQRYRGNAGKDEPFKFLWNELPPPGAKVEPGRHAFGNEVPLDKGVMIEVHDGPYSWNRFDQRFNTGWMREWPESFLDEAAMLERTASREYAVKLAPPAPAAGKLEPGLAAKGLRGRSGGSHEIGFLGRTVTAGSNHRELAAAIGRLFAELKAPAPRDPAGEVYIEVADHEAQLMLDGEVIASGPTGAQLLKGLYREVVTRFIHCNPQLVWLHSACAASLDGAVALPGPWGRGKSTLALRLYVRGWSFLTDDVLPLDPQAGTAIAFPVTPQVRQASGKELPRESLSRLPKSAIPLDAKRVAGTPPALSMIVFPHFLLHAPAELAAISPAQAAGELLENCLSFPSNSDATIQAMCNVIAKLPTYSLRYSDPDEAVELLIRMQSKHRASARELAV
jgi:hypothetical protein